jgi:hypothetical protein
MIMNVNNGFIKVGFIVRVVMPILEASFII